MKPVNISEEGLSHMSPEERLPIVLEALEAVIPLIPADELRSLVSKGEALMGKGNPALPSGRSFDRQTRKGRLYLDLLDDLEKLNEEYR